MFAGSRSDVNSGSKQILIVMDWSSKKLTRVARSSLTAEAQGGANGVDALEWLLIFLALVFKPDASPVAKEIARLFGPAVIITDCKALYDATHSVSSGLGISEKRTAIEVRMMVDRVAFIGASWRWVNSDQQLADGMTKASMRLKLAEYLRKGYHSLEYDPDFVSAKKSRSAKRFEKTEENMIEPDQEDDVPDEEAVPDLAREVKTEKKEKKKKSED